MFQAMTWSGGCPAPIWAGSDEGGPEWGQWEASEPPGLPASGAIRYALRQVLQAKSAPSATQREERLTRFLEEEIWPLISPDQLGTPVPKAEREEILRFGQHGASHPGQHGGQRYHRGTVDRAGGADRAAGQALQRFADGLSWLRRGPVLHWPSEHSLDYEDIDFAGRLRAWRLVW